MPFWLELKVAKVNAINIAPHQVAWNMAYYARKGCSFFLVKSLSTRQIHLFTGEQGPVLAQGGLSEGRGPSFKNAKELFEGLRPLLEDHFELVLRPSARDA